MGLPIRFGKHLDKTLGEGSKIGLLNTLKSELSKNANARVNLLFNRNERRLVGVNDSSGRVTPQGYFDLLDRFMNDNSLDIQGVSDNDAMFNVTATSSKQLDLSNKLSLPDEVFKTGVNFRFENGEVSVRPFTERLICANGMVGRQNEGGASLTHLSDRSVVDFFNDVQRLADRHWVPTDFADNVSRANTTFASVHEMNSAYRLINSRATAAAKGKANRFIPLDRIKNAYDGHEDSPSFADMTAEQMQRARTDVPVWDVINGLTNFASHDYSSHGFKVDDNDRTPCATRDPFEKSTSTVSNTSSNSRIIFVSPCHSNTTMCPFVRTSVSPLIVFCK